MKVNKSELRKENPHLSEKELHNLYVVLRRKTNPERHKKHLECVRNYKKKKQLEKVVKPHEEKTSIIEDSKKVIQIMSN